LKFWVMTLLTERLQNLLQSQPAAGRKLSLFNVRIGPIGSYRCSQIATLRQQFSAGHLQTNHFQEWTSMVSYL
jgi:hypothetical protein